MPKLAYPASYDSPVGKVQVGELAIAILELDLHWSSRPAGCAPDVCDLVFIYLGDGCYKLETLASADDRSEANGSTVFDYPQALKAAEAARARYADPATPSRPYTVSDAISDYIIHLEHEGKKTRDARNRANLHILPELGLLEVDKLSASRLREWMGAMAERPARVRTKTNGDQAFRRPAEGLEERRSRRATANRTFTILKAALNHAWRENRVADDKAWRSVRPFAKADSARVRFLQVAEAKRVRTTARNLRRR